jgi:predicted dehydrogenase
MTNTPIKVAVVGVGHRAVMYASYALAHPERMKVVAVADPDANRRAQFAQTHSLPQSAQFENYQELAAQPRLADAVINGTLDKMHVPSSLPFLQRGYHLLLEKPIAPTENEVLQLQKAARENNVTVMICHVLRYAPFYAAIKEVIASGEIGEIVSIHTSENVSYHHTAVGFVRGKWNKKEEQTPMLLAKCCHDLDIIAWLMSGIKAERVASFGSLKIFKPENAPPGSALRCLDGCEIEPTCPYSAKANYVDANLWSYAWEPIEHIKNPTREQKLESLKTDNPYGRCVWHCDNDVVDHQSVIVEFENGATATHDMFGATAKPGRDIHIIGTTGELQGDLEDLTLVLRRPDPRSGRPSGREYSQQDVPIAMPESEDGGPVGHGGGDVRLIEDFISVLKGEATSKGVSRLEDSLTGHRIAFAAETARLEKRVVEL